MLQYSSWDENHLSDFVDVKVNCLDPNNRRIQLADLEAIKKVSRDLQAAEETEDENTNNDDDNDNDEDNADAAVASRDDNDEDEDEVDDDDDEEDDDDE